MYKIFWIKKLISRKIKRSGMNEEYFSPYETLEISPFSSYTDIKAAYQRLAKIWHPDKNAAKHAVLKQEASNRFQLVQRAWEEIRQEARFETDGAQNSATLPVATFVQQKKSTLPLPKTENARVRVPLSLAQRYNGCTFALQVLRHVICSECSKNYGNGRNWNGKKFGDSKKKRDDNAEYGSTVIRLRCNSCGGKRTTERHQRLILTLQPGILIERPIQIEGFANESPDCEAGDLIIDLVGATDVEPTIRAQPTNQPLLPHNPEFDMDMDINLNINIGGLDLKTEYETNLEWLRSKIKLPPSQSSRFDLDVDSDDDDDKYATDVGKTLIMSHDSHDSHDSKDSKDSKDGKDEHSYSDLRLAKNGQDLWLHREIPLHEALLGIFVSFRHLDGRKCMVRSPPGPNQAWSLDSVLKVTGQGMPLLSESECGWKAQIEQLDGTATNILHNNNDLDINEVKRTWGDLYISFSLKTPTTADVEALKPILLQSMSHQDRTIYVNRLNGHHPGTAPICMTGSFATREGVYV